MRISKLLPLIAALLLSQPAYAQNVPAHTVPIGAGTGVKGWHIGGPCLNGQALIWSGVGADPACGTPSAGSLIIGTSPITGGTPGDVLTVTAGPVLGQNAVTGTLGKIVTDTSPTIDSPTITTAFTATGLVTNADLANAATTVNGQTCTLGSTCTAPAAAGTLTGATLAAGVTASSLTSFGASPTIASPAITGSPTGVGSIIAINGVNCNLAGSCTVNPPGGLSTTVNGQTCTLGGTCTVTADANTLTNTTLNAAVVTSSLTAVGTIATGVWNGTTIALANGGTNNALTASAGGIVWTDASKFNVLAGTVTAAQCLLSGSNAAPTWGSCSGAAAVSAVANSDGTLTISPTTGSVTASLALGHAQTWTGAQTFTNSDIKLLGSSTGVTTFTSANAGASNFTATVPANSGTVAELNLAQTWTANQSFNDGTLLLNGSSSGNSTIKASATGGGIATLPAGAGTLVYLGASASFQGQPSNPTGITSHTAVMTGLGSTCTITPATSGRIHFEIAGFVSNGVAATTTLQLAYGTGTAPVNAAAATGTTVGPAPTAQTSSTITGIPFWTGGVVTGLSPGTAYWFDLQTAVSAGTTVVRGTGCDAFEY